MKRERRKELTSFANLVKADFKRNGNDYVCQYYINGDEEYLYLLSKGVKCLGERMVTYDRYCWMLDDYFKITEKQVVYVCI